MSHPQPVIFAATEENDDWQPHASEEFQQVGLVGRIAIGLLGASTVTHLLSTWSDWNTYSVVNRYLGGMPNVDDADLNRADTISRLTSIPNVIISVAAAVVFVIWLWRARVNSEVFCQADHRHSHGWVLASWFCPGPNLWYPKQIVDDVWLASDPKTPVYADDLRRFRKPALTSVWWCSWVGALAFDVVIRRFLMWMDPTVGSLRGIALAGTASLLLTVASAIGATMVIRKLTAMQTAREWIPWWDPREPRLTSVPTYELTSVPTYADDDTSEQQAISEQIAATPPLRLSRQPELQLAGGGGGFGGDRSEEEPPKWSPFAAVVETWQEPVDSGPSTQQFNPYEAWRDESGPVEEATPSHQQSAAGLETPSWSTPSNPYTPATSSDDLLSSAPLPSWQAESVAPPSLSLVQTDPYTAYRPSQPSQPEAPSWASSYSDTYSYDSGPATSDYLASSTPVPAPEPEPAPVARAGRRAARVAVDSPSTIQAAVPSGPDSGSGRGYYEQAPVMSQPPSTPLPDDFLTPSKPLPPVPSFGPEPSYTPEPTYTAPVESYTSYDAPAAQPSYETSYNPEPSYSSESTYQYSTPEPTYNSESTYGSSSYESYTSEPSYDSYSSTHDSSYSQGSYSSPETSYSNESYETPSYTPNYTPEPVYAPETTYSSDYSSSSDYTGSYSDQPSEYQQPSPYAYEAPSEPAKEKDDSEITAPRTHPRRRWV